MFDSFVILARLLDRWRAQTLAPSAPNAITSAHPPVASAVNDWVSVALGDRVVLWESSPRRRDGLVQVIELDSTTPWPALATCTVRALTTIVTWTPEMVPPVRPRYRAGDTFHVPIAHLAPLGVMPAFDRHLVRSDGLRHLS